MLKPGFVDRQPRGARRVVAARERSCAAFVGFVDRRRARPATTRRRCAPTASCSALYHKRRLPNYAVFDEQRYFVPGAERRCSSTRSAGCRWACRSARTRGGPAGRSSSRPTAGAQLDREHQRVAVPRGQGDAARGDARSARRRGELHDPLRQPRRRPGRAGLRRRLAGDRTERRGDHARRQYTEELFVTDVERRGPTAARCTRRARRGVAERRSPTEPLRRLPRPNRCPPHREVVRRARARHARLRAQERLHRRGARVCRVASTRRWWPPIAVDALGAEHVHGVLMPSRYSSDHSITDAEALAENLGIDHRTIVIEPAHARCSTCSRPSFEGTEPGHHRGEPAAAHPRHAADGAVEQVRLAGADHRQQERDGGRLHHALRRHGRRLRRASRTCRRRWSTTLAEYRNARRRVRPHPRATCSTKPPSAELRPDQVDTDSLPRLRGARSDPRRRTSRTTRPRAI